MNILGHKPPWFNLTVTTADYRENTGKNKGAEAYNTPENCLEEEEKNYYKVTRRIKTIVIFTNQPLVLQLAHKEHGRIFSLFPLALVK